MKKILFSIISGPILLLVAFSAISGTIEPDDYPEGTYLSNIVPGVQISPDTYAIVPIEIYDDHDFSYIAWPATGELIFGRKFSPSHVNVTDPMRIDFSFPVYEVSIDTCTGVGSKGDPDAARFLAFDSMGNAIDAYYNPHINGSDPPMIVKGNIAYVIAEGWYAHDCCLSIFSGGSAFDNLVFNNEPEPPVSYGNLIIANEDTPIEITLNAYDLYTENQFLISKPGYYKLFPGGDDQNFPDPSTDSAQGDHSAYFESANNEYLKLNDNLVSPDFPWTEWGSSIKTGTIWLKFKSTDNGENQTLFSKYRLGDDTTYGTKTIQIVKLKDSGQIMVKIGIEVKGGSNKLHYHGSPLNENQWYAVCVSFEQNGGDSSDPEKVYIEVRNVSDGSIVGDNYSAIAFDDPDNDELYLNWSPYMIGAALKFSDIYKPFNGNIDEVVIFNYNNIGDDFERYVKSNYTGQPVFVLDFEHTPLEFSVVNPPLYGTLSGVAPNLTYTPNGNYFGSDSFTFKANNGVVDSNIATVDITVEPENDAPVITGQLPLETKSGVALEITLNDLIVNDIDNDYPEDFTLHVQAGPNYSLKRNTITPNAGFTGTLVVPVYVNDGTDNSNRYNLNVTVNIVNEDPEPETDSDNDGISDAVEAAGPNSGDANNDGTQDSLQSNVASLITNTDKGYVVLESPPGTVLSNCQTADNPSPDDAPAKIYFAFGFFDFTISGLAPGGSTILTITLPNGMTPKTYYKYGKTQINQIDHWYEFLYDGETGVEINSNVLTFHFVDALRGDDILVQDSMVIDLGGPGFDVQVDDDGGGGGGCFIDILRY